MFETTQIFLHEAARQAHHAATDRQTPVRAGRYGSLTRWLHWLSAVVILWALASGLAMAADLLGPTPKAAVSDFNVAITTVFLPIFLLRMAWTLAGKRPGPLSEQRGQQLAARVGHCALYAMTSVVLLSGVLMMDRPIDLFGLVNLPQPLTNAQWCEWFADLHRNSSKYLTGLLVLHLAAVAWHELRGRRVLQRML